MAARKHREIHDVEQTKKKVPLISCGITFSQHVSELFLGVNIFDLDFGAQIDSVKQPVQRNSVGSGQVSHSKIIFITASLSSKMYN